MTDQPARLAPGQLGHVGVLLLRQHRAARGVGVVERAEAELLGGPQHQLLAQAREVHAEQRDVEQRLGHEVAVRDGIERVLEAAVEAELRRHEVGVEREGRTGERARTQGRDVEPVHRHQDPVHVPGQGPAMGQQVMGQQDRLGPLQVGVAGQVDVRRVPGPVGQDVLQGHDLARHPDQRTAAPQAQVGGDLVVAAPPGVQLGADRLAGQLGHPALDRGVDVLVPGLEDERRRLELLRHQVEGVQQLRDLALGQEAHLAQPLDVGARAGEVVGGQHLIEGEADREVGHGLGHPRRDAALPQGHELPGP